MEIAKIIKIFIQRYRVISLKAPSIITPSSIMLHDPTRSESPLVYLTPLLWRFVLLTERLRGYTPPPPHLLLPPSLRHLPRAFSLFTGTDRCDLGILINVGISSMNWLFWTDSLDWCIMSSAWTFLFWALMSLFSFRGSKFLRFEKKW